MAAGGGGDAITAAALGPALGLTDERPVVMTYAWDRLIIDPLPGPRSAADFTGLRKLAPDVLEILPTTEAIPPAGSTLPRLAAELPARLLLLDPAGGALGMARQIAAAVAYFRADRLALVDVGGDVLACGKDEGLRSPLADLLALAACSLVACPTTVLVPGAGVDCELPELLVRERIERFHGDRLTVVDSTAVKSTRGVYEWHPSEASGLFALAAEGVRGRVEVRDAGTQVTLSAATATVWACGAHSLASAGPAAEIAESRSLSAAATITRNLTGVCELDYETRKAALGRATASHRPVPADLVRIDRLAAEAAERGSQYTSVRRLAEAIGARCWSHLDDFRELLRSERPSRYRPPAYAVAEGDTCAP